MAMVVGAFLPQFDPKHDFPGYGIPSLVWFEQKGDGKWKEWVLERRHLVHPTVKCTDIDGNGDLNIVAGCFVIQYRPDQKLHSPWLEVWENQGKR